jgi:hypothetical protein
MSGAARDERRAATVARVQATVDIDVLRWAAQHPSWRVRRVVASHMCTPSDVVSLLAADPSGRVRIRACTHPALDSNVLTILAGDPWLVIRERVAGHRLAPLTALLSLLADRQLGWQAASRLEWIADRNGDAAEVLARSSDPLARWIAASSPHPRTHELLMHDRDAQIRARLIENPVVSQALLLAMCKDDETAAAAVSNRPDLAPASLRKLARRGVQARRAVAAHPALRPGLGLRLGIRREPTVVAELVRHRSIPRLLFLGLVRCGHWSVQCAALESRHASRRLVKRRLRHRSAAVRCAAISSPLAGKIPRKRLEEAMGDRVVALAAVVNPVLPASVLDRLLRRFVPDERKWPTGCDRWIVGAALGNPGLPLVQFARLADASAPAWAMRRLATNPAAPADVSEPLLTMLALGAMEGDPRFDPVSGDGNPGDPALHPWAETNRIARDEPLLRHPVPTVRANVAAGLEQLTHEDLLMLAEDPDPRVRSIVLRFQSLSPPVRKSLVNDPTPWIRALSTQRIPRRRSSPILLTLCAGFVALVLFIVLVQGARESVPPQEAEIRQFIVPDASQPTEAPLDPEVVAILLNNGRVAAVADGQTQMAWACRNGAGQRCGAILPYRVQASGAVATPRIAMQLPPFPAVRIPAESRQPPFESVTGLFVREFFDFGPMSSGAGVIAAFEMESLAPGSVVRISTGALVDIPIEVGRDRRARRVMVVDLTGNGLDVEEHITLRVEGHDVTYQLA